MFNFDFFKKRSEVSRAMTHRLNHACMEALRYQDRKDDRAAYSQVIWIIPTNGKKRLDFAASVPAVSKDISKEGLSLIHTAAVEGESLLVALPGENGHSFLQCKIEHCTALGYGFFQIGLHPENVANVKYDDMRAWKARCREFEKTAAAN